MDGERLKLAVKNISSMLAAKRTVIAGKILATLAAAYLCASAASVATLSVVLDTLDVNQPSSTAQGAMIASGAVSQLPNYRDIRKSVMDRNVFNSEGTFPEEDEEVAEDADSGTPSTFNASAPCVKSKLNLTLLGTIVMGKPEESMATVREQGYAEADVYRVNDEILDHPEAKVFAIERNRLILNNNGVKECLEQEIPSGADTNYGVASSPRMDPPPMIEEINVPPPPVEEGDGSSVTLDSAWVEAQLGPGFAKIVNDARLVPHIENNKVQGFKIFAIKPSSLFSKVGLRNGDVVVQASDVNLTQPEQGFALYQVFQDEREFSINVQRGGNPVTIQVQIK